MSSRFLRSVFIRFPIWTLKLALLPVIILPVVIYHEEIPHNSLSVFSVWWGKINQQSFFCASYIPKFSRESNTKRYFCPKISHLELQQLVLTIPLFVPHHFHWNCFEYLFRPLNSRNDYSKHNQLQCSCRPLTIVFKQTSKIVNRPFNIIK